MCPQEMNHCWAPKILLHLHENSDELVVKNSELDLVSASALDLVAWSGNLKASIKALILSGNHLKIWIVSWTSNYFCFCVGYPWSLSLSLALVATVLASMNVIPRRRVSFDWMVMLLMQYGSWEGHWWEWNLRGWMARERFGVVFHTKFQVFPKAQNTFLPHVTVK
jgi:hypothetical protein